MSLEKEKSRDTIRVYLLLENRLTREALARLLQKQTDVLVVGQNWSHEAALRQDMTAGCDVLIVDSPLTVSMPKLTADRGRSKIRTIVLGMEDDPQHFLDAVRSGISGYLLKDASCAEIILAVRSVACGEAVCPRTLCMSLFERISQEARFRTGMMNDEAGFRAGLRRPN